MAAFAEKPMIPEQDGQSEGELDSMADVGNDDDGDEDEEGAEQDRINEQESKAISFYEEVSSRVLEY